MSLVRQNFHESCEAAINKQINKELYAHYVYLAMASHFSRADIALKGFHKYFSDQSLEERTHANKLMEYQSSRGGRVVLVAIDAPPKNNWSSPLEAMEDALQLEKEVNESLLQLHTLAGAHNDPHLQDYVESNFLTEQVDSIKEIADHITNLRRVGTGLGEFMYDKELQ